MECNAPRNLDGVIGCMIACHRMKGERGWTGTCGRGRDATCKAMAALEEALKSEKTMAQLSSEFGVHANQIRQWRRGLLAEVINVFSDRRRKREKEGEERTSELYRQIGQGKVDLEWLKKGAVLDNFDYLGRPQNN